MGGTSVGAEDGASGFDSCDCTVPHGSRSTFVLDVDRYHSSQDEAEKNDEQALVTHAQCSCRKRIQIMG
jgi:hypothetical protein